MLLLFPSSSVANLEVSLLSALERAADMLCTGTMGTLRERRKFFITNDASKSNFGGAARLLLDYCVGHGELVNSTINRVFSAPSDDTGRAQRDGPFVSLNQQVVV